MFEKVRDLIIRTSSGEHRLRKLRPIFLCLWGEGEESRFLLTSVALKHLVSLWCTLEVSWDMNKIDSNHHFKLSSNPCLLKICNLPIRFGFFCNLCFKKRTFFLRTVLNLQENRTDSTEFPYATYQFLLLVTFYISML